MCDRGGKKRQWEKQDSSVNGVGKTGLLHAAESN